MKAYPEPVSQACLEKILTQMKNSIYQIYRNDGKTILGIGFFCYIKYEEKEIPVVIINNYEFNKENIDSIKILKENEEKEIKLGNVRIKNKEFNVTVIEIEENNKIKIQYLEIDDRLYKKDYEYYFNNDSLYIIQYFDIKNILVSNGRINNIYNNNTFKYLGYNNIKGSIIFNSLNNKIIGLHNINKLNNNNIGLFFKIIIESFKIRYKYLSYEKNEINMVIKIEKEDINKKIYFLNNNDNSFKEINESNAELYINDKKENIFKKYFFPGKEGEYQIKLKINKIINDCSYMFAGCNKIINININSLNIINVKNMEYMFYNCKSLINIDLSSFEITNVENMSYMFYNCENLKNLELFSFKNKNIINMEYMFYNCKSLNNLDLSFLNFKNVNKMSDMFFECSSLNKLPDISKWNTTNVNNMSYMFSGCRSLNNLPDISKWNTKSVTNMSFMFFDCRSLNNLLDISKWNTTNVEYMNNFLSVSFKINFEYNFSFFPSINK